VSQGVSVLDCDYAAVNSGNPVVSQRGSAPLSYNVAPAFLNPPNPSFLASSFPSPLSPLQSASDDIAIQRNPSHQTVGSREPCFGPGTLPLPFNFLRLPPFPYVCVSLIGQFFSIVPAQHPSSPREFSIRRWTAFIEGPAWRSHPLYSCCGPFSEFVLLRWTDTQNALFNCFRLGAGGHDLTLVSPLSLTRSPIPLLSCRVFRLFPGRCRPSASLGV